jgi:hypothetical protein
LPPKIDEVIDSISTASEQNGGKIPANQHSNRDKNLDGWNAIENVQ